MPAFDFNSRQIDQLRAFMNEIDRPDLGRGELRMGDPSTGTSLQEAFESAIRDFVLPADVSGGFETFRTGLCKACHFPFQTSIVGAPDLSTTAERLSETELVDVLTSGKPETGMPPPVPELSPSQINDVIAYFFWLNEYRGELENDARARQVGRSVNWWSLPWWEYR
jgi:cytochrome c553